MLAAGAPAGLDMDDTFPAKGGAGVLSNAIGCEHIRDDDDTAGRTKVTRQTRVWSGELLGIHCFMPDHRPTHEAPATWATGAPAVGNTVWRTVTQMGARRALKA